MKKVLLLRPYQYVNKVYCPYFSAQPLGIEYVAMAIKDVCNLRIYDALAERPQQYLEVRGRPNVYHGGYPHPLDSFRYRIS